jgi:hypothetical protein
MSPFHAPDAERPDGTPTLDFPVGRWARRNRKLAKPPGGDARRQPAFSVDEGARWEVNSIAEHRRIGR